MDELEALAAEGLNSGEPFEADERCWDEKHRRLDEMLREESSQYGICRRTGPLDCEDRPLRERSSSLGMTVLF